MIYNGEDGFVVSDPDNRITRRLAGTHGGSSETRPINLSADGKILVYSAGGSCTREAAEAADPDADDDRRVCLAYLPPADDRPAPRPDAEAIAARADCAPADAASRDPWVNTWDGAGALSAAIRRGTAKPDYRVIDLVTVAKVARAR